MTAYLTVGDTVRWCDDPKTRGTVVKISVKPRRDMTGVPRTQWSHMVQVKWPTRVRWCPPELLVKVAQ